MATIIIKGVIILLILSIFGSFIFSPSFRRNVGRGSYKLLKWIFVLAVIAVIVYVLINSTHLYINESGREKYPEKVVAVIDSLAKDTDIEISIRLDTVTINGKNYHNMASVDEVIGEQAEYCEHVRLIDDYAYLETYEKVYNTLISNGVNAAIIEETEAN